MVVKNFVGALFYKGQTDLGMAKLTLVAVFCWSLSFFYLMPAVSAADMTVNLQEGNILQSSASTTPPITPTLYVVNFTADWCPNCKILDPALEEALVLLNDSDIEHVAFDLTNRQRTSETFNKVNGTILAGVYGDYVGVTGLVVMVAPDSGEIIGCATRLVTAEAIALMIEDAKQKVQSQLAGTREAENLLCPPANRKIPV